MTVQRSTLIRPLVRISGRNRGYQRGCTNLMSSRPTVLQVVGTRPNFMKTAPIVAEIRRRPALKAATIMMLSSGGHASDAARCEELHIASYLIKPVRESELRSAVARALGDLSDEEIAPVPAATENPAAAQIDVRGGLKILIAEDNPVNQLLLTRLLVKRGHSVKVAGNGKVALDMLESESEPFDLVFMDVQMPEMDGMAATRELRARERQTGAHLTLIGVTAHALAGDRERCLEAGMDGYLSKPIRIEELDAVLERQLATYLQEIQ